MTKLNKFLLLTAFTLSGVASVSHADDYGNSHMSSTVVHDVQFAPFKPQAKTSNASLDYKMLDAALENTVFRMGLSARRHMSRPDPLLGSRITSGHTSPYRLEGSRVMFSFLTDSYIDQITEYRADLEGIANRVDISTLDRKEQLAFWFNLHNIVVIEQIAYKYPTTYPHKIKIDGVPLDEAKIIDIRGVKMSLRDIREKIVYPNWESPLVIYGFFRGDIGSPALQNYAYTGDNVSWVLNTCPTTAVSWGCRAASPPACPPGLVPPRPLLLLLLRPRRLLLTAELAALRRAPPSPSPSPPLSPPCARK